MMQCDRCGRSFKRVVLHKMEWWCQQCEDSEKGLVGTLAIQRDGIPGGMVLENYGPHPIRFDSHSERRAYMAANGLSEKEKFSPFPGTDKDPQGIPNPAGYMDPQTLLNAAEMICRNGQKPWDAQEAGVLKLWPTRYATNEEAIDAQVKSRS